MIRKLALTAIALAALAVPGSAQLPGELIVVDTVHPAVLTAKRGGAVSTLQPLWPTTSRLAPTRP